ncbi:hypothetical protein INS49_013954 [Diaporthe citri]|uniref:uncharacterized protein n=1 Tax=Diaporthe citri TaxID=83186 RepID=UPI001C822986|nr:uncharacterized protein INS49_013954 [Diaporthe citri]KAG6358070.1 hypothetical protein INS49_013954 [Diaporthe citri]
MAWKTDEGWSGALHSCDAMSKWPDSGEPDETGFALAHGGQGVWPYLSERPDRLWRFADMMRLFSRRPGLEAHHVVKGYPWGDLPHGATVVDVGGSHGVFACSIAREFPSLNIVVQDLDEGVIPSSEKQRPEELADRVHYQVHDFMTKQPVRHADVYFFRAIFHNWSHKYAIEMLRNLVPALKPGAKFVMADIVIPSPDKMPKSQEVALRTGIVSMHLLFNSADRELEEWAKLFAEADPGFDFKGRSLPPEVRAQVCGFWRRNGDKSGNRDAWGAFITVLPVGNYIVSDVQPRDKSLLVFPEARL